MLIVISPAKSLELEKEYPTVPSTTVSFEKETEVLIKALKKMSSKQIGKLMDISPALSDLNYQRFQDFTFPIDESPNVRPAIFMFDGDVYTGLDAFTLKKNNFEFTQKHLRILSGLYGLLRPFDLMQPYRLEMGTDLKNKSGKSLYAFWGEKITNQINEELANLDTPYLINLASNEYFSAIKPKLLNGTILQCQFKEKSGTQYKIISFTAKRARGLMARFIIDNKIHQIDHLKSFDLDRYVFNASLSTKDNFVFTR